MRISDWSSDVCSSDLDQRDPKMTPDRAVHEPSGDAFQDVERRRKEERRGERLGVGEGDGGQEMPTHEGRHRDTKLQADAGRTLGSGPCGERVGQDVYMPGGGV